ncbi:MAG: molybdopterin molybdenumtransferase MoeA [Gemmatimonadetes bacterium]|nr:molybdopterin molybdenumtransferase MoeA [Gemmatimonadota bacterium]
MSATASEPGAAAPGSTWPARAAADWLRVEEARARVLALVEPLPFEVVPLARALHRALAQPIVAAATLPPWDNSAMDGYAVRGADVAGATPAAPIELRVVGEARAGERWDGTLATGEALRIMTGGPVPAGADTVVRVEDTDREARAGQVSVCADRDRGRNVRPGGQDMQAGDVLLRPGDAIGPGAVATAAAAGLAELSVHRRPRVAVLTSGDELRGPDSFADVKAGRGIPDTNGPMLLALAAEVGAEPVLLGPVRDDPAAVRERLEHARAADVDLLITVGGAALGATDLFAQTLAELGVRTDFWRVKIRPGSPFSAGLLPRPGGAPLPVLGLPGNPASAFATFHLFVRPALLRLGGHLRQELPAIRAVAGAPLLGGFGLTHFLRVRLDARGGVLVATPTGPQGSGLVGGLAAADGLAVVPEGSDEIAAESPVTVLLLRLPYVDAPAAR